MMMLQRIFPIVKTAHASKRIHVLPQNISTNGRNWIPVSAAAPRAVEAEEVPVTREQEEAVAVVQASALEAVEEEAEVKMEPMVKEAEMHLAAEEKEDLWKVITDLVELEAVEELKVCSCVMLSFLYETCLEGGGGGGGGGPGGGGEGGGGYYAGGGGTGGQKEDATGKGSKLMSMSQL